MKKIETQISINQSQALKTIEAMFTGSKTYLQELLQNAVRAKATELQYSIEESENGVQTLTLIDNGCGIADFDILQTAFKSDWDHDCNPYGVGFFAAIFSAEEFEVHSLGRVRRAKVSELIENGIAYEGESEFKAGTKIILRALKEKINSKEIDALLRGLSLNGGGEDSILAAKYMVGTPFGLLTYNPGEAELTYDNDQYDHIRLRLQGFSIRGEQIFPSESRYTWGFGGSNLNLHLNDQFKGRIPDRAQLRETEGVSVPRTWKKDMLRSLAEHLPISDDALEHFAFIARNAPERVRALPVFPAGVELTHFLTEEICPLDDPLSVDMSQQAFMIRPEHVDDKHVFLAFDDRNSLEDYASLRLAEKAAREAGITIVAIHPDYVSLNAIPEWLPIADSLIVSAEPQNPGEKIQAAFAPGLSVMPCQKLKLSLKKVVKNEEEAVVHTVHEWMSDEPAALFDHSQKTPFPCIYLPEGRRVEDDHLMAYPVWFSENNEGFRDWDDSLIDSTCLELNRLAELQQTKNFAGFLRSHIEQISLLAGQSFTVTFDDTGRATVLPA